MQKYCYFMSLTCTCITMYEKPVPGLLTDRSFPQVFNVRKIYKIHYKTKPLEKIKNAHFPLMPNYFDDREKKITYKQWGIHSFQHMLPPGSSHHARNEYRNSPYLHLAVKTDVCSVCDKPSFSGKN